MVNTKQAAKKLTSRVTKQQKVTLLKLLKSNKKVGRGQYTTKYSGIQHELCWKHIASELNSMNGSKKSPEQWKRCWIDWKAAVKRQYAKIKVSKAKMGNRPLNAIPKPLDAMDTEVIQFFTPDFVEADQATHEADIDEGKPHVFQEIIDVQPSTSRVCFDEPPTVDIELDEPASPHSDIMEPAPMDVVASILESETEALSSRTRGKSTFRKQSFFEKAKTFAAEQNDSIVGELKQLNCYMLQILKELKEIKTKLK